MLEIARSAITMEARDASRKTNPARQASGRTMKDVGGTHAVQPEGFLQRRGCGKACAAQQHHQNKTAEKTSGEKAEFGESVLQSLDVAVPGAVVGNRVNPGCFSINLAVSSTCFSGISVLTVASRILGSGLVLKERSVLSVSPMSPSASSGEKQDGHG